MSDVRRAPGSKSGAAIVTERGYYLIVAQFTDTTTARKAYDELRRLEKTTTLRIDGVVVAHRSEDGKIALEKMTEHSTRSGLRWGVVGGIVVGALFPPTILAGAVGVGALGALAGKIRNLGHRADLEKDLGDALEPGTSGIVALVEDRAQVEVERALAQADRIVSKAVDRATAMQIDAEAKAAREEAGI